jgi:hypothetical protein
MRRVVIASITLTAVALAGLLAPRAARAGLSPDEVQQHWIRRLTGRHYTAIVRNSMKGWGDRRMTIHWDDTQRHERLMVRVDFPDEMRGDSWVMLENTSRANEYYIYSTRRASAPPRRVPMLRKDSPFAVPAYDYLGFRVAHYGHPVAKSVTPETIGGRKALKLTEEAKDMIFERRVTWLDAESFVPLRAEYWRADQRYLVAETEKIETVQGVETPTLIRFTYAAWGNSPELTATWRVESIDYQRPILESFFSIPR